jgi:ketosteroid isomerase-like protein
MSFPTRTLAAGAALMLIAGLGSTANAPPQAEAERGVRRALMRLNGLLAARDMAVVDEFAKGEGTLLIGSAAGESYHGRSGVEGHFTTLFALPETMAFSWREVNVAVRGAVAWLAAEGELILRTDAGERRLPYRLNGVFELQGGQWKWRLFHGSEPTQA